MFLCKGRIWNILTLSASVVLLAGALCLSADLAKAQSDPPESDVDGSEQDKQKTLREVAQNWIQVGITQFKKGFYKQAEESFLAARELQEYLTAEEHKELEQYIADTGNSLVERKAVLEDIQKAKDLVNQGEPIKARMYYEKARNNPYLTEQERRQIADELKKVDVNFDKQKKEITALYNRSVELYRAGEIEKAREGFVEVAKYGLLVTPPGQTPEDYLIQIDSILIERRKSQFAGESNLIPPPAPVEQPAVTHPSADNSELDLLPAGPEQIIDDNRQPEGFKGEMAEVAAAAEPTLVGEKPDLTTPAPGSKTKIIRTYTKAVVENAELRAKSYINKGEFDKAVIVLHNASDVVGENRAFIGNNLFIQYTVRLKYLADKIISIKEGPSPKAGK
jgi:hypothetical protein